MRRSPAWCTCCVGVMSYQRSDGGWRGKGGRTNDPDGGGIGFSSDGPSGGESSCEPSSGANHAETKEEERLGSFPHVFGPNKPPWPSQVQCCHWDQSIQTRKHIHMSVVARGTFQCTSYKRLVVYSTALNLPSLTAINSFSRSALIPLFGKEGYKCVAAARHIFMFPLFTRCWQELNKKAIPPPLNSLRAIYLLTSACSVRWLSNGGEENE